MRKFLCLYLNTGGGHKAPALVLKQLIEERFPDSEVLLVNGISKNNRFYRFVIEKWYDFSCKYIPGSWALFFSISMFKCVQTLINITLRPQMKWYMLRILRHYKPTDVISFHSLLTPFLFSAIRIVDKNINFTTYVTDPFTVSSGWFVVKNTEYLVASQHIKDFAIKNANMDAKNVKIFPFLVSRKFYETLNAKQMSNLQAVHAIHKSKKVLLVTGGGGGLPNVVTILQHLLRLKPDFTIIVICGKDVASKNVLEVMSQLHPKIDLRIFGFISNMHEMIQLCDLAIIKPGASTIFETLGSQKPVIISKFLYGQELGNVQYVIDNKVGWFIQNPKEIASAVQKFFNDDRKLSEVKERLKYLKIDKKLETIADYIYYKGKHTK